MVSPSDVPRRRNGFSPPYSSPQISSWLFLLLTAVEFGLVITPILPFVISLPVSLFFLLCLLTVIYFGLRALGIDSMDIHLRKTLAEQRRDDDDDDKNNNTIIIKDEGPTLNYCYQVFNGNIESIQNESIPEADMETKQCWICDTQVANHSMHCKYCNKCVCQFDHHCLWLNTCIGKKNYQDFFRVMLAVFFMQLVHLGVSCAVVVDIFWHGPTEDRADHWMDLASNASIPISAVILFFMAFDVCSLILLAQLIAFHVHLHKKRISTYQYIVQDAQKRREKAKLVMELEHQRMAEMTRAAQTNNHWYGARLKWGRHFRNTLKCPCLDPLDMPQPPPEPDLDAGFAGALGNGNNGNGNNEDTTPTTATQSVSEQATNGTHVRTDAYNDEHDHDDDDQQDRAAAQAPYSNNGHAAAGAAAAGSPVFLPVANSQQQQQQLVFTPSNDERHELDSQATQSELGDPEDIGGAIEVNMYNGNGAQQQDGGLLGANPRDEDNDDEENLGL